MKTFKFILRRFNSFLCDLALAYGLFYLLMFIRPVGFPISAYYFCSIILYFGLTYWLFHAGFMQKISGIEITKRNRAYVLFKILLTGVIPFCITCFLYEFYLFTFISVYLLAIVLLTVLSLPFTKKSLWQWFSGAKVELRKDSFKSKSSVIILLAATIMLLFFPLYISDFRFNIADYFQNNKKATFPVSISEKNYYVKNIQQYKEDPINYVMQLFDKYDIVILCERWHAEYTQWEFFSKLILNEAFASKVQNVFIELGTVQNQERLDSYMNAHFSKEEDLQRATAGIVRENGGTWPLWHNTNIYDFILHLHQYNETKDNLNNINLFFTDDFSWDGIENPVQYDSLLRSMTNRDSIMAYHVTNRYEAQHLNKCLLITNTVHAWNYWKFETAYIFKKFPNKTAVVWINNTTQTMPPLPVMNGTLDAAALEIPDSIWAIDFKNCPLGNTLFDLSPMKRDRCTYKDLFVGMVYCQHPNNWIFSENYPFILDNYMDIFLKRSALLGEKYLIQQKKFISKGFYNKEEIEIGKFVKLSNLMFLTIHSLIMLFLFLNLFIKLLSILFRKKVVDTQ